MRRSAARRVIAVITSTRADWGLLSPLVRELHERGNRVPVIATGTHLSEKFGMTVDEIIGEGFDVAGMIPVAVEHPVKMAAQVMEGVADLLPRLVPDAVILLGDRYESLAAATAATLVGVPIVHIAGGTVSEGAIDDNVRHAITKLSVLHLVETEMCRDRVRQMGEDPESVVVTGALGVHNILATPRMSRQALEQNLQWRFGERNIMATLHGETRGTSTPLESMHEFLGALDDMMKADKGLHVLMTYPNNDVASGPQIELMKEMEARDPLRFKTIPSLGRVRFMSTLDVVDAVAGNSSGGIVEVPSAGVPVLDVGLRQQGREHGPGVWHCAGDRKSIVDGLRTVLSEEARTLASRKINPYHAPDTPVVMADAIERFDFRPFPVKHFHTPRD